eukprot:gene7296-11615_t
MSSITQEFWDESVKELDSMDGWKLESENKEITTYTKKLYENTDMKAIKCITTVDFPADLFYKVVLDSDTGHEWSPSVEKCNTIEKGDDWSIMYMLNSTPISMVSKREMIIARKFKKIDDDYYVIAKSTTHKDYQVNRKIVRAEVFAQNVRIRKNKDNEKKCDVVLINLLNLGNGGWIPGWVNSQIMNYTPDIVVENFQKGCEYHMNK